MSENISKAQHIDHGGDIEISKSTKSKSRSKPTPGKEGKGS